MSLALPALLSDVSSALAADAPLGHALRVLASLGALVLLATLCCAHEAAVRYARLRDARAFDLDAYIGAAPSLGSRAKVVAMHALNVGAHRPGITAIPLAERASPHMRGLRVTLRAPSATAPPTAAADGYLPLAAAATGAIVVGTIRMGFGHHRIAYAAASWGVATGRATYFHDLLAIESAEAKLISDMDRLYSQGSRLASELGGAVERMWGALTKSGDADALRVTYQMAEHLRPLLLGYDRDTPLIATHCLVGLLAVACGFRKVVNLVIDNHAQWFIVVPGALNLVQGPSNYHALLKLGVPASQLRLAGHWIPKDLVDNLAADCAARVARATARAPLRVLLPVGGAGAQRSFICKLVAALVPAVAAGRVQLLLNAGDHGHMREAFVAALAGAGAGALPPTDAAPAADGLAPLDALPASVAGGLARYACVSTMDGVRGFCDGLRAGRAPAAAITLFAFADYFPAVATTDQLCRVADVLACKPSELAFYPVPKLMIRRVGDHEAYSAVRASELGDGTFEARELGEALEYIALFGAPGGDLVREMNGAIVRNGGAGVYDGCKVAVETATSL